MRKTTIALLILILSILIGWDIVVTSNAEAGDTFSEVILHGASRYLGIAYAFGAFTGHLFWPRNYSSSRLVYWGSFAALIASAGALLWFHELATKIFFGKTIVAVLIGLPMGVLLWPQKKPAISDQAN